MLAESLLRHVGLRPSFASAHLEHRLYHVRAAVPLTSHRIVARSWPNENMEDVMRHETGIWIDHKKAVIVNISGDRVSTKTLSSDVAPHPHYAGSQEGGGERKYEERHQHDLDRYYDEVVSQVGETDALLLFGPGEAKLELKNRLGRSPVLSDQIVAVESTDKLTDRQIVARVKEHYGISR